MEITTRCNAHCPLCPRNFRGSEFNGGYPLTELSLSDVQTILPPNFLRQIHEVSLNGNLGDFGMARDGPQVVEYLLATGVRKVTINSNASMRTPQWWVQLARPGVEVHFAIDGLEHTHVKYRQGTDWHRVMANAHAFIQAGGRAVWQFIPFEFNKHEQAQCQDIAKSMGFAQFLINDQGRNTGPVYNRQGEFSHWLHDETDLAPPVADLLAHHVTWFSPATHRDPLDNTQLTVNCLTTNLKTIYIAADGSVYPCCYLGFYPDTMQHPGNSQIAHIMSENNALTWGLEHSIRWFLKVEQSWALPNIQSGRLFTCTQTCGVS